MTPFDLASLVAPLSVSDFVKRHWERRALYAPGDGARFAGLFDRARLLSAAEAPSGPHADDPRRLKAGFRDARGEHAELAIHAAQVEPLVAAGMTVQIEWLHESDEGVAAFADEMRASLAVPVELDVAAFLSPPGSGYGLHFDTTSMFILQLAGTKRWHYARTPSVERPLTNVIPDAAARAAGIHGYNETDLVAQDLSPGDVLYLPAGAWHHVKATTESLHVCLTLRPVNVLDLARGALLDDLLSDVDGRALPLRPGPLRTDPDGRTRAEAFFAARLERLRAAVARLTPAGLYDAWIARHAEEAPPPIERDTVLTREVDLAWRRAKDDDGEAVLVVTRGDEVLATLSAHAEPFVRALAKSTRFRAGDAAAWEPSIPWDDVAMLLGEFASLGVLARAAG
jgi:ribosomal protein L16 Arg81 hydroxylase